MSKEPELWKFVAERLRRGERVMLLVVAKSTGSSPGRAGYKMAVAEDGDLCGSIGGGVMEVSLVGQAIKILSAPGAGNPFFVEQVHRKDARNSSGMICSGTQTVIFTALTRDDLETVDRPIDRILQDGSCTFQISNSGSQIIENQENRPKTGFTATTENVFLYQELVGKKPALFIIGGGHCALALSEMMSKLGFRIAIFDDRPSLNTLDKNEFADEITIIDSYENTAAHIPHGPDMYVVVMTLGYVSDAIVIRQLIDHDVRYLGVLGSKAKMATLMRELKAEGFAEDKLARIHTPIGIPINSRSPEEIAVSIAAEIISIKNA